MPSVGQQAPDFELPGDNGTIKLSDFRGKNVVLYFYPKDFTSGCELQACQFRDAYSNIEGKNAVVLGVSPDSVESHKKFREELHLPFHLVADENKELAQSWGAFGPRKRPDGTEYMGIIRSQYVIDSQGKIIDIQNPVTPKDSAPLALEALEKSQGKASA